MDLDVADAAEDVDFDYLEPRLGKDIRASIESGISWGIGFAAPADPTAILRQSVRAAIRRIQSDSKRYALFQRFLLDGPYVDMGSIPDEMLSRCLSDAETAWAIRLIYYSLVNSFQGALGELLAIAPCVRLIDRLHDARILPKDINVFFGDKVAARAGRKGHWAKAADFHILGRSDTDSEAVAQLVGVAEVKSYPYPELLLLRQIESHINRARRGLRIRGVNDPADRRIVSIVADEPILRIGIVAGDWAVPRTFRFEAGGGSRLLQVDSTWGRGTRPLLRPAREESRLLHVDSPIPPNEHDTIKNIGANAWLIVLRWSHEALASTAYDMTFWFMGKLGAAAHALRSRPIWSEMSPEEAGSNSAKMMLYYAILRCRSLRETERAIALYNAYGFGYAVGANFRDEHHRREMLWPEDLDEIAADGKTKHGGYLDPQTRYR